MANKDELLYKINEIIKYLKDNGEYDYVIDDTYIREEDITLQTNILEYAEDV